MNFIYKLNLKILSLVIFIFLLISHLYLYASEVKIITKINNEIITNIDIEKEYQYLIALNKSMQDIEKDKIINYAKQSIIKEKIKKIELQKFYVLNQKNEMIDVMIEGIYQNLDFNSTNDFKDYLKNRNLNFDEIYKKIEIETLWNQMIYEKYNNKVIINEENLKKEILKNPKEVESYYLYELVYDYKNKDEVIKKYKQIMDSINLIGFKETVLKFSISQSKTNFGLLGWINKNALSDKIQKEITNLSKGEITKPIIIPSGILLLKLEDKKIENLDINIDEALKEIIKFETNNQLNNYSVIHFNKVKSKLFINEY